MSELAFACPLSSVTPGEITPLLVGGRLVALYLVGDKIYCTEDLCTHEDCAISDGGFLDGVEVECACHGARFDVRTGEVTASPAIDPLRSFPVEVRDGQVYVAI